MHNQDMSLVLSTDAKPRLKWTTELHYRFVEAVNQLGGADKATPKSLVKMMGIPGLTLYHLKSHLQKYRLGKNQSSETCSDFKQDDEDDKDNFNELNLFGEGNGANDDDTTQEQIKENIRMTQALQMQMEVQRKLHEQIEVQRHLQLRIEAQGKYLQKVLKKAQETLSNYHNSSAGVEQTKTQLSHLVSMVSGSSFSELTEITDSSLDHNHTITGVRCSVESSSTSSESSGRRDEGRETSAPFTLSLLNQSETGGLNARKRSRSTTCDVQTANKRSTQAPREETGHEIRKLRFLETFDLNSQCENDLGLDARQPIELQFKGAEQLSLHL